MTAITAEQLACDIERFLAFKRALGWTYRRGAATLRSFERFVRQQAGSAPVALDIMVARWLARAPDRKPVTITLELGVIRQLCRYRRRTDPDGFVPGRDWAPQAAKSQFVPTIFSPAEIRRILVAASEHQGCSIWGPMLRLLILMLYCTGLRPGEAVRLQLSDVDLQRRTFTIGNSKGKTRIVAFGEDLAQELQSYLDQRAALATAASPPALLIRRSGEALPVKAASAAIRRLFRRLGLKPSQGRVGPRPYDFRHAFAVHRLSDWYRQGVDIQARLPWLSAYMGHNNVLGTEVYLTATPELLALASQRFEARLRATRRNR